MLPLPLFLLQNMMDALKPSGARISAVATDVAFTFQRMCVCLCVCVTVLGGTGGYLIPLCCWRGGCSRAL